MEWTVLENHFLVAASQEPSPFGDEAVEWDHSRYSRALGLVGTPGLHELKHTGCAMLATVPRRWGVAEERYRRWAKEQGWDVLRLSARPTVAVPDPVVHGLAVSVCGPDSLVLARSGRSGRPVLRRGRVRPDGMSLPLAPADRWLIAADRVRRRVRTETALRGLVLFIDEAHKLTASALSILGYLVDAHRAWRARMLARDAKVYLVLATTPEREESVRAMLERFSYADNLAVGRDKPSAAEVKRRKQGAAASPVALDVMEEHLMSALLAAPLALTREDCVVLFGASAVETLEGLAERDIVRRRVEDGKLCYVPNPACFEEPPPAPPTRVVRALLDRYRERIKRGHEHLVFAMAALAFRLEEPIRAIGYLGRAAPGDTVTISLDLLEEIERHLDDPATRAILHNCHRATWMSLRAHQRDYKGAQQLAAELTTNNFRSQSDLGRTLAYILGMGRTHTDQILQPDFWAGLKSDKVDGALLDALCIFSELYVRQRHMSADEVVQRYEVAASCIRQIQIDVSHTRSFANESARSFPLLSLAELSRQRIEGFLQTHYRSLPQSTPATDESVDEILAGHVLPGYLAGSTLYGFYYCAPFARTRRAPDWNHAVSHNLMCASGNCGDSVLAETSWIRWLTNRGMRLLARDLGDNAILLRPKEAPQMQRARLSRSLSCLDGRRSALLGTTTLVFATHAQALTERLSDNSLEAADLASILMLQGDFAGARKALGIGLQGMAKYPVRVAMLLQLHIRLCLQALEWKDLEVSRALIQRYRNELPPWLWDSLESYLAGAMALVRGNWDRAETLVQHAYHVCECENLTAGRMFLAVSRNDWLVARKLISWRGALTRLGERRLLAHFRKLFLRRTSGHHQRTLATTPDRLDAILLALNEWARAPCAVSRETTISIALWLRQRVDPALRANGTSLAAALAHHAPDFFGALCMALGKYVHGSMEDTGSSTAAVDSALKVLEEHWGDPRVALGLGSEWDSSMSSYEQELFASGSQRRIVRMNYKQWLEDASTFWACIARTQDKSSETHHLQCYGHLGQVGARKVLRFEVCGYDGPRGCRTLISTRSNAPRHATRGTLVRGRSETQETWRTSRTRAQASRHPRPLRFWGSSSAAVAVRELVDVAARCDYSVLILGETGSGKEVVARCIHSLSARSESEIVIADSASTVDSLLESELFGHVRGAFTGAHATHRGLFARANASTLFLDEVDSMTMRMQASLLRVLETGEYRPVGGSKQEWSDFRLLSAALPDLRQRVEEGVFREDLYYRISTLCIHVPPLREREGDAVEIAVSEAEYRGLSLSSGASNVIEACAWPGNVRQLLNSLDVAALSARGCVIGESAMSDAIGADIQGVRRKRARNAQSAAERALSAACMGLKAEPFDTWDFARAAGVSRRSAQRYLAALVRVGRLVRSGAGRATSYRLES